MVTFSLQKQDHANSYKIAHSYILKNSHEVGLTVDRTETALILYI